MVQMGSNGLLCKQFTSFTDRKFVKIESLQNVKNKEKEKEKKRNEYIQFAIKFWKVSFSFGKQTGFRVSN